MANDTTKKPDVKDAADNTLNNKTSGQLDPTPEKADPSKVVSFEQVKTAAKENPPTQGKADKVPDKPMSSKGKEAPAPVAVQPDKDAALQKEQEALLAKSCLNKGCIPTKACGHLSGQ